MSTPNRRDPDPFLRVIARAFRVLSHALQHDSHGIRVLGWITWLFLLGTLSTAVTVLLFKWSPSVTIVSLTVVSVIVSAVNRLARVRARATVTKAGGRRPALPRAARGAARLLPASARDEHREEWAAWIIDLRAAGTPRRRRWAHLLTIVLIAAPRLAITLRLAARRAVDR